MPKRLLSLFIIFTGYSLATPLQQPNAVKNPHGNLRLECQTCHTTETWVVNAKTAKFDHSRTGFALIGAHAAAKCANCHESLVFAKIGAACVDCHTDIHRGELGKNCESCHNSVSWENRQEVFQQHLETRFPLLGAHALTDCESCHFNQQRNSFKNTPVECNVCHAQDYLATSNPNHQQAGFPMQCQECHPSNSMSWVDTEFDHAVFPLTGAHKRTACEACHVSSFTGTPNECSVCHQSDYQQTTNPNHQQFSFQTSCESCHNSERWEATTFNHEGASGFALVAVHNTLLCAQCHVNNQVTGIARDCFGCHETDYRAAADPNHAAANYPHDCTTCHSQNAWQPANFDHNRTAFPLTGAHQTVQCANCHTNNVYTGTPSDCYSCHNTDFSAAVDPNHVTNNFDHNCMACHNNTAWQPATFNHNTTAFPLTGAHTNVTCANCHTSGYTNTPSDCYSCHQKDFAAAVDPNHTTNNFDHNCMTCHNNTSWQPATFNHANTAFPLTGAHTNVTCANCHTSGYTNTPMDCFFCHQTEYNQTTNPNHKAAQFPQNCESCHSTANWTQTTYDHDTQYFPINSGAHRGKWDTCAECHVNNTNYKVFECVLCHEHNQSSMNSKHQEVRNYQFSSAACYDCHPRGKTD